MSRTFYGNLREAKVARCRAHRRRIVDVSKGRHSGTRATVDDLFADWIVELKRKGRSPHTVHGYERTSSFPEHSVR